MNNDYFVERRDGIVELPKNTRRRSRGRLKNGNGASPRTRRRGAVLMVILVCFALVTVLFTLVARQAFVANRLSPCWPRLFTVPNSPPMEMKPSAPVMLKPAWPRPLVVPTVKSGNQLYAEGEGVPLQSLYVDPALDERVRVPLACVV